MKQELVSCQLDESKFAQWNDFVAKAPAGSIYSNTEYLTTLCAATGGSFRIAAVLKGGQLLAGIALYETKHRTGVMLSNRLLLYYNGIVLAPSTSSYPSETCSRDLASLLQLEGWISQQGYVHSVIHNRAPSVDVRAFTSRDWKARPSYSYVVNFKEIDSAWSRVEQNLRRLIKRCEAAGGVLTEDDDFDSFFKLHIETHHRKGAPIYLPEKAFRKYFLKLRELGMAKLFHARSDQNESMASQLVLMSSHPVTHTVCAAADKRFLSQGATPFLRWKTFEYLQKLGYSANDLTDAALNDVTHFKSQLGGELVMNIVLTKPDRFGFKFQQRLGAIKSSGASLIGRFRNNS